MLLKITKKKVQEIFAKHNLPSKHNLPFVESLSRIPIGFTNEVYSVNDSFILKVCKKKSDEVWFKREVSLYTFFAEKIPVPQVIVFDSSKKIIPHFFMIYHKIQGENLYTKWHELSDKQRKRIIQELCTILKVINTTPLPIAKKICFRHVNERINWYEERCTQLKRVLHKVMKKKLIDASLAKKIKLFIQKNAVFLHEQKISLVYYDVHFDNILVRKNKIVGLLDFEMVNLWSLDYVLTVPYRMISNPKEYASKQSENLICQKDYSNLLLWFQKYYPELFNFKNLKMRLVLYSITTDLKLLLEFPKSKSLKKRIEKIIES